MSQEKQSAQGGVATQNELRTRIRELIARKRGIPLDRVTDREIDAVLAEREAKMARGKLQLIEVENLRREIESRLASVSLDSQKLRDALAALGGQADKNSAMALDSKLIAQRVSAMRTILEPGAHDVLVLEEDPQEDYATSDAIWALYTGLRIAYGLRVAMEGPGNRFIFRGTAESLSRELATLKSDSDLSRIRDVLISGEPAHPIWLQSLRERLEAGGSKASLSFLYVPPGGEIELRPTPLQRQADSGSEPVISDGPIDPNRFQLLDGQGRAVPQGARGGRIPCRAKMHTDRAFQLEDGSIRLERSRERQVWKAGNRVDLPGIEARILESGGILDVRVVVRANATNGLSETTAYCVPADRPGSDRSSERLRVLSGCDSIQWVSSIPLLETGDVDESCLCELPAIDARTLSELESEGPGLLFSLPASARFDDRIHVTELGLKPSLGLASQMESQTDGRERDRGERRGRPAAGAGKLAYANGGALRRGSDEPRTLIEALEKAAIESSDRGLLIYDEKNKEQPLRLSYSELRHQALRVLGGLRQSGLVPGDPVILQVPSLPEHFATLWACILGGLRPVTVAIAPGYSEPNGVVMKLFHAWSHLRRPAVLTSSALSSQLTNLKTFLDMGDLRVLEVDRFPSSEPMASDVPLVHAAQPDDVAFYQLTSGSTGAPKCIQITHRGVLSHVAGSRQFNGISGSDVELNWLQMDHVVPVLTCHFRGVVMRSEQIHVRTSLVLSDPLYWLKLIDRHRVTHTWSPNFGFKLVADTVRGAEPGRWNLSCLKAVMNAGEQVTAPAVHAFAEVLAPHGFSTEAIQPAFGMAEACTCMTYRNQFDPARDIVRIAKRSLSSDLELAELGDPDSEVIEFVSCGGVVPGVEIRIADAANRPLPEGRIGRLQIRGDVVTPGYLDNPVANQEAFVGDGWFNSGDLGFLIGGELHLAGREKEMIVIQGANYYCYEIEELTGRVPGVVPGLVSACALEDSATATESLAVIFVPQDEAVSGEALAELIRSIRRAVSVGVGITPAVSVPLPVSRFARTTSGKIQRTAMKKSLLAGEYDYLLKRVDLALANDRTLPAAFFQPKWMKRELVAPLDRSLGRDLPEPVKGWLNTSVGADRIEEISLEGGTACILLSSLASGWIEAIRRNLRNPGLRKLIVCLKGSHARASLPVLSAWLRSVGQEYPDLRFAAVWVEEGAAPELFINEIQGALPDPEVRIDSHGRWVRALARVEGRNGRLSGLPASRPRPSFVVSGGLGGVGRELCQWLLLQYPSARIVVLGRSDSSAIRPEGRHFLRQYPSVRYHQADVASADEVQSMWALVAPEWENQVDGIFHLAGELNPCSVDDESAEAGFQSALGAKLEGLKNLAQKVRSSSSVLVAFSSLNAWLGGRHAGPYSAANAALEAECERLREEGVPAYCISWSQWLGTGLAAGPGSMELAEARGFLTLSPKEAMLALQTVLSGSPTTLGFGLNPRMPRIARELHSDPRPLKLLARAVPPGCSHSGMTLARDRFGVPIQIPSQEISALNESAETIDRERAASELSAAISGGVSGEDGAPKTPTEKLIAVQWSELFDASRISRKSDFFQLGGHSLLATQFVARVSAQLAVELPLAMLFTHPRLSDLANAVDSLVAADHKSIEKSETRGRAALSFAQERLWVMDQLGSGGTQYHISEGYRIRGSFDVTAAERAIREIFGRHDVLRSRIESTPEGPRQVVDPSLTLDLEILRLQGLPVEVRETRVADVVRELTTSPFDVSRGNVFKVRILATGSEETLLWFSLHHLVADAWSIRVMMDEFRRLYRHFAREGGGDPSEAIEELPIQYADFAEWQRRALTGDRQKRLLDHWLERLGGHSGELPLPTDSPRPAILSFRGKQLHFRVASQKISRLTEIGASQRATLFMVLFAAFNLLLARLSGQKDLLVGVPVANRLRPELERLIGFFVNLLPVRTRVDGEVTFSDMLSRVRDAVLQDFEHQELPFEQIVGALGLRPRVDRHPLVQAVFVMQNVPSRLPELEGAVIERIQHEPEISKFDLTLSFAERDGEVDGMLEYSTDLFTENTMKKLLASWDALIDRIAQDPKAKLESLLGASDEEVEDIASEWLKTGVIPASLSSSTDLPRLFDSVDRLLGTSGVWKRPSPIQRDLLFGTALDPESALHSLAYSKELPADIQLEAWKKAWSTEWLQSPALNTRFFQSGDEFYQRIGPNAPAPELEVVTGLDLPEAVSRHAIKACDPYRIPVKGLLIREPDGRIHAVLACHHAVADARSADLFLRRVEERCLEGFAEEAPSRGSLPTDQVDPAKQEWDGTDREETVQLWTKKLGGCVPLIRGNGEGQIRIEESRISSEESQLLRSFCARTGMTLPRLLRAAHALVLEASHGPEGPFVLHEVRRSRSSDARKEASIGCRYEVVPYVIDPQWMRSGTIANVDQFLQGERQALPGSLTVLQQRRLLPVDWVRFYFNYYGAVSIRVHESYDRGEAHLMISEEPGGSIGLRWAYDASVVPPARYLERLRSILLRLIQSTPLKDCEILLEDEIEAMDQRFQGLPKETGSAGFRTVVERFEAIVERFPDRVAMTDRDRRFTYRELNSQANQLANLLRARGLEPGSRVGVWMDRSSDCITSILAILKAGATYVPMDPGYPSDRVSWMIEDAAIRMLLTHSSFRAKISESEAMEYRLSVICLDQVQEELDRADSSNSSAMIGPQDAIYVIYTSGSTGRPKGTELTHENVCRLFARTDRWFGFGAEDVWTWFHSIAFDFSVWEIWGALLYGGRLVIVPFETSRSPSDFLALCDRERVTVLNQTPTAFQYFQTEVLNQRRDPQLALRWVIFGGEALQFERLLPWFDRFGFERPRLVNMYGITETTVHVTFKPIRSEDVVGAAPSNIGIPIPDLLLLVVDRGGRRVPPGQPGELWVSGPGVAKGYLNRDELTAQRFVEDPWYGLRTYRSGDLVRSLPGGELEYLGRIDQQVKVRGFRIELGEIEQQILRSGEVRDCAVLVRRSGHGTDSELIAFFVPKVPNTAREEAIRASLRQTLPEYMIPTQWHETQVLPMTGNGKLDRVALLRLAEFAPVAAQDKSTLKATSGTEVQKRLARIWAQVLEIAEGEDAIGLDDRFYDRGGHSLRMVRLQARINEEWGTELSSKITVVDLFQHGTVRTQAELISRRFSKATHTPPENDPPSGPDRGAMRRGKLAERRSRRNPDSRDGSQGT